MKIVVAIRVAYGCFLLDPVNREAKCLAAIAGTKTLTPDALGHAKNMGCEIEVTPGPEHSAMLACIESKASFATGRRAYS